jgi:hypothetical protein
LTYETRAILLKRKWQTPDPLRKLAGITHFDLFISTTFDSLLEQALNEVRFKGQPKTKAIAYSEKSRVVDIEAGPGSSLATVYQLFGKLDIAGDYGLTEEKILEFTHRLQTRDLRPQNLFDALQNKSLLILGCGLPGWLARFFLRSAKGEKYITQGARGVVADKSARLDVRFTMFLQRRQSVIYDVGDAVQFVDELHRRWMEKFPPVDPNLVPGPNSEAESTPPSEFKVDSVFLSYASEDREYAQQVYEAFFQAGVDVWFDVSKLKSGVAYGLDIDKNIEDCSYFVPLISRHSAVDDKRFFQREWNKAIFEAKSFPEEYPFIQPVLLDDTSLDAPGIPREFKVRQVTKLADLQQLVKDANERIKKRRFARLQGRQA